MFQPVLRQCSDCLETVFKDIDEFRVCCVLFVHVHLDLNQTGIEKLDKSDDSIDPLIRNDAANQIRTDWANSRYVIDG